MDLRSTVLQAVQQQWGGDLIQSWNKHDWIGLPQRIGSKLATLLGAHHDEVRLSAKTSLLIGDCPFITSWSTTRLALVLG